MKILISPSEVIRDPNTQDAIGVRLCDIAETAFEVAEPLFWLDCPADVSENTHCYNADAQTFVEIPAYIPPPQPVATGAQTL